ncbi:hypothetical protein GIB67_013968 [Kingdonia uniflora]|uniref:Oxidation resistance protein 1 n=1 Tax=Kingdonia uniflora TaxID=39325 RepID=A0A7J7LDH7_9MAGN|nr:hypothetical protein GIB67_013968 [Kingdonia uniflora]
MEKNNSVIISQITHYSKDQPASCRTLFHLLFGLIKKFQKGGFLSPTIKEVERLGNPPLLPVEGANRYFTLCSTDFLALGGGGHFALYLDGDLLRGSSSNSETFGNPCLAHTEDFDVKELEV